MSEQVQIALIGAVVSIATILGGLILALINRKANTIDRKADTLIVASTDAASSAKEAVKKTEEIHTKVDGNLTRMQEQLQASRNEVSTLKSQLDSYQLLVQELIKKAPEVKIASSDPAPGGRRIDDIKNPIIEELKRK